MTSSCFFTAAQFIHQTQEFNCIITRRCPADRFLFFFFFLSLFFNCHHVVLIKGPSGSPHFLYPTPLKDGTCVCADFNTWKVSVLQRSWSLMDRKNRASQLLHQFGFDLNIRYRQLLRHLHPLSLTPAWRFPFTPVCCVFVFTPFTAVLSPSFPPSVQSSCRWHGPPPIPSIPTHRAVHTSCSNANIQKGCITICSGPCLSA